MLNTKPHAITQSNSGALHTDAGLDAVLSEATELGRQGKLDEAALARIDTRMQKEFERLDQEHARTFAEIEERYSSPKRLVLPKRFRIPAIVGLIFLGTGAMLETTLGEGFVFSYANAYRSAMPWIFSILLPLFAVGWFLLERANHDLRGRYPTWWVRWLLVFPLIVVLSSALVVVSPLGWAALSGWAIGSEADGLEAKVVSIGTLSRNSRGCDQSATLKIGGNTASICLEGRLSGATPEAGDTLAVVGRISGLGVFIDKVRPR